MARRVLHDPFFKQAKAEGYLARSAYKLVQIQEHKRLMRAGDRVLDLGCAPGAWIQAAGEIVGPSGLVVGIDLQRVDHRFPPTPPVATLEGDIYKTPASVLLDLARSILPPGSRPLNKFDAVISDMAPNTTGHGDHERSVALCDHALSMLPDLLRPGGACTMKIFEGGEYPRFLRDVGRAFESAKGFKPEASRSVSREMYIVATGYRGAPGSKDQTDGEARLPRRGGDVPSLIGRGKPGQGSEKQRTKPDDPRTE